MLPSAETNPRSVNTFCKQIYFGINKSAESYKCVQKVMNNQLDNLLHNHIQSESTEWWQGHAWLNILEHSVQYHAQGV